MGRYAFAGLCVLAAALITVGIAPFLQGRAPLFAFTIAVIASAWFGGLGPGLVATGLSILIVVLFLIPRIFSFFPVPPGRSLLGFFTVLGVVISIVAQNLLSAAARLADAKQRLELANLEGQRRQLELQTMAEALSKSNEELQRFASAVSHDLRQPLRTIKTCTELLLRKLQGRLDADSNEMASLVVDGVRQMEMLINGLLDYSKVTAGQPEQKTQTDLNLILNVVLKQLKSAIDESGAVITSGPLPLVIADHGRMLQVFQNLLDNAIKYRSSKTPRIHVSAAQDGDRWLISVSDNGIGIDPQHHGRIFDVFQRLHPGSEYDGAGIGLAMVKRIVEQHGGRVWVESNAGEGSTFRFTIL